MFTFSFVEPVQYIIRTSPLIQAGGTKDPLVDPLKDLLAHRSNIGFGGVDQSAINLVRKPRFVIFNADKGSGLGHLVNPISKIKLLGNC